MSEIKNIGPRGPYAVLCDMEELHGAPISRVFLTPEQYSKQLRNPDALWRCPVCGMDADWDDENYSNYSREDGL